jgi:hypothetical protein
MVEFISLNSSKLGSEFINNESISSILVLVREKQRMTKVDGVGI